MTIWVKDDSEKVQLGISGDVNREHIEFLQMKLLDRIQSGYRRIIINMHNVGNFDMQGLDMLKNIHHQVSIIGGELIIEGKYGLAENQPSGN